MNVAQIHVKMVESVLMETIGTCVTVLLVSMEATVRVSFQYTLLCKGCSSNLQKNFISINKVNRIKVHNA